MNATRPTLARVVVAWTLVFGVTSTGVAQRECRAAGEPGLCVPVSECGGRSVSGACPGPSDVQCCVPAASGQSTPTEPSGANDGTSSRVRVEVVAAEDAPGADHASGPDSPALRITVLDPNTEVVSVTVTLRTRADANDGRPRIPTPPGAPLVVAVRSERPVRLAAESPVAAPARETARLSLITTPWSEVYIDGVRLGGTPLLAVEVPVGDLVLELRNPEEGLRTLHPITIASGSHARVRIALR